MIGNKIRLFGPILMVAVFLLVMALQGLMKLSGLPIANFTDMALNAVWAAIPFGLYGFLLAPYCPNFWARTSLWVALALTCGLWLYGALERIISHKFDLTSKFGVMVDTFLLMLPALQLLAFTILGIAVFMMHARKATNGETGHH